jgi:hypothetical protein
VAKIAGGNSIEPIKGFYRNEPIDELDVKGMYPLSTINNPATDSFELRTLMFGAFKEIRFAICAFVLVIGQTTLMFAFFWLDACIR